MSISLLKLSLLISLVLFAFVSNSYAIRLPSAISSLPKHFPKPLKRFDSIDLEVQASNPSILPSESKPKIRVFQWIPDGIKNALASSIASILVRIILQPFDTIKTIQQYSSVDEKSIFLTAKRVIQERGFLGLWSGTFVSTVFAVPSTAVYFGVFSTIKKQLTPLLPLQYRFIAIGISAMIGNAIASVARVPYEVFKQRLQVGLHKSLSEAVRHSWKTEGLLGIFANGKLTSQIVRDVPYAIIGAITYDLFQQFVNNWKKQDLLSDSQDLNKDIKVSVSKDNLGFRKVRNVLYKNQDIICGALAGGISSFLTTPMDVIKTRLMISNQYSSVYNAMVKIMKDEGFLTFFAGNKSRLLHKIPANALFFFFYESFRFILGAVETRSEQ